MAVAVPVPPPDRAWATVIATSSCRRAAPVGPAHRRPRRLFTLVAVVDTNASEQSRPAVEVGGDRASPWVTASALERGQEHEVGRAA